MSNNVGDATEGVRGGGSAHSPTLTSLHLRHSSFSSLANPSVAPSTSQLVLQPFCRFAYATCTSPTSPGKPPQSQILDTPLMIEKRRMLELGKPENSKKTHKNPEIAQHSCPPYDTEIRILYSSRIGRTNNRERKK